MNRNEKVMLLVVMALVIGYMVGNLTNKPETDLEIYTPEDTYYVKGKTLTSESQRYYRIFESTEDLKEYLSDRTIEDTEILLGEL